MDLHSCHRGEPGRFEQILNQFLLKSLHVILDSRVPPHRPAGQSGDVKKSDKWFNLVLGDRPAAMESLSFWNRSLMEPMIIEIILVKESQNTSSEHHSLTPLSSSLLIETVAERWIVQYESPSSAIPQVSDASYKKTYKKSIVLLRSVYSMLRLLPAYKAFRKLCSLNRTCDFDINYKVYSYDYHILKEEKATKKYNFTPIDAQHGCLSLSVIYLEDLSEFDLDAVISCPPEIITDYVGSPLTAPLRELPSTSFGKGVCSTSFPIRGKESTSTSPFQRPHSWTSDLHRNISARQNQNLSGFPCEYSTSPTDLFINRVQNQRTPAYKKYTQEDFVSPPFSLSSSPSPPAYFSKGNLMHHHHMRSETAPMSIPHPMKGRSPRCLSLNLSDPSRHSLPPLSPRNTKCNSSPQGSHGVQLIKKYDPLKSGELNSGPLNLGLKVSGDSKDDSGRFSSLQSSNSSPRFGFSRSSSRLSFQDDFGDCDFSCPFIVDDVDSPDFQTRLFCRNLDGACNSEFSSQMYSTAKRSQDAAVGALVHLLKKAPPLHQDSSNCNFSSAVVQPEGETGPASDFFKSRKTADALEELEIYKEMKYILLSKSEWQALKILDPE